MGKLALATLYGASVVPCAASLAPAGPANLIRVPSGRATVLATLARFSRGGCAERRQNKPTHRPH